MSLWAVQPWEMRPFICPDCEGPIQRMRYDAGESVRVDLPGIDPSLYDVGWVWGRCPLCDSLLHTPEIAIASDAKLGWGLVITHSEEARSLKEYWVSYDGDTWLVQHLVDVAGLTYGRIAPGHSLNPAMSLRWIDYHFLDTFSSCCLSSAYLRTEAMAADLVPKLVAADLWSGARQRAS